MKWYNYKLQSILHLAAAIFISTSCRIVPGILAAYISIYINSHFDDPILTGIIFIVSFWIFIGVFEVVRNLIAPSINKRWEWIDSIKACPLTDKYGENYKRPTFEQFDLTAEEYHKAHKQNYCDDNLIFIGVFLSTLFIGLNFTEQRNWKVAFAIFLLGIFLSTIVLGVKKIINSHLVAKSPNLEKVSRYDKALRIYKAIGRENGEDYRS